MIVYIALGFVLVGVAVMIAMCVVRPSSELAARSFSPALLDPAQQMFATSTASPWHGRVRKILYINLDHRTDRQTHMESVFSKLQIPRESIERVSAIRESEGWLGCTKSHLKAVQLAIERGYDYVCILEDDFMPLVDAAEFQTRIDTAWQDLKGDFDMIVLAMTPVKLRRIGKDPLYRIDTSLATPGYIISKSFMRQWASIAQKSISHKMPIDMSMQESQKSRHWYGFFPPLARQLPGYSDIENRTTDYAYLEIEGKMLQFID